MTTIHPMIERAARALCRREMEDNSSLALSDALERARVDRAVDNVWPAFVEEAVLVIRALREPDEGMVDTGVAYFPVADTPYRPEEYGPATRQVFTAMIDSILPEEGQP